MDELRELSKKATPGEWVRSKHCFQILTADSMNSVTGLSCPRGLATHPPDDRFERWRDDVKFIVACVNYVRKVLAQPVPAEGAQARLQELQSEFAILSRACGNWREWPEGTVSKDVPDYTHDDWKAAARAILERNELRATAPPATAAPAERPPEGIQHPDWGYDPDGNWVRKPAPPPTPASRDPK
jgi:hypothetical protein